MKLAILQRVCPSYRGSLFRNLSTDVDLDFRLFYGESIPGTKVRNSVDLNGINGTRHITSFIRVAKWVFPWHRDLFKNLIDFKPDVIICEAESHLFGSIVSIIYKYLFNNKVRLIYWCYIEIPGTNFSKKFLIQSLKKVHRKFYDAFLLYSSYGIPFLKRQGFTSSDIFVATNVGDVVSFSSKHQANSSSKEALRNKLGMPDRFTVLYVGTLDWNKKPYLMLDLASKEEFSNVNFLILGDGPCFESMKNRIKTQRLDNVLLKGKVTSELAELYSTADVCIIPGRGGIAISEAMCFGLPVIIHQADGTEYDLIMGRNTGIIVDTDDVDSFSVALSAIFNDPQLLKTMSENCKVTVSSVYNTNNMVRRIKEAAGSTNK